MTFRRIIFISILSLIGLWILTLYSLSHRLPSYITKHALQYGWDLSVNRISTDYFSGIKFDDIVIRKPIRGTISSLRISFRPWLFPKTGQLFFADFENPDIQFQPLAGSSRPKMFLFRLRTILHNGKLKVPFDGKEYVIHQTQGHIDFGPLGFSGKFDAHLNDWGPATAVLSLNNLGKTTWHFNLISNKMSLSNFLASPGIPQKPILSKLTGDFNVRLSAEGESGDRFLIKKWKAQVNASSCQFNTIPMQFDFELNPEQGVINSIQLGPELHVSGNVLPPWEDPFLNLRLESNQATIEKSLSPLFPQSLFSSLKGTYSTKARIEGPIGNPVISGEYSYQGSYHQFVFPPMIGRYLYQDGVFSSSNSTRSGQIYLRNSASKSGQIQLLLQNLSLDEIGEMNKWNNISGTFAGQFTWANNILQGRFGMENFQWARIHSPEPHKGYIKLSPHQIVLKTDDNFIGMDAELNEELVQLKDFHFNFGEKSHITSTGRVDFQNQDIALVVEGVGIPPDLWPPLVSHFPEIKGSMTIKGDLHGPIKDPQLDLGLEFSNFQFISRGGTWNGSGKLLGTKNSFSLRKFQIEDQYIGNLDLKNNVWSFHGEMVNASPRFLLDIARIEKDTSGTVFGPLNLKWDGNTLIGNSSFTWNNGRIDEFFFDRAYSNVVLNPNSWALNRFELIKTGSAIRLDALGKKSNQGWDYSTNIQLQQWGSPPFVFDGEINSNGNITSDLNLEGDIKSPALWIQNNPLDRINGKFFRKGSKWNFHGQSGDSAKFDFKWDTISKKIEGNFNLFSFPIEKLIELYIPKMEPPNKINGDLYINGQLAGSYDSPQFILNTRLDQGTWRGQRFKSQINFLISEKELKIQPSKLFFNSGGEVDFSGILMSTTTPGLGISGTGTSIPLSTVIGLLGGSLKWDGTTNAKFNLSHSGKVEDIHIDLEGEHEGLGPFHGPGEIEGTISGNLREMDLSGLLVTSGDGFIRLLKGSRLFIEKSGAGKLRIPMELRNLAAGLLVFYGDADMTGSWEAKENPENDRIISLDIFARSLWVNQYYFDGNVTRLTLKKGELTFSPIPGSGQQLSGNLKYHNYPETIINQFQLVENGKVKIFLDGDISSDHWDYHIELNDVDASFIGGILDRTYPLTGPMSVMAHATGAYSNPNIKAEVKWKNGTFYTLPLDYAQAEIEYKNGDISLQNLYASKKKGYVLKGKILRDNISLDIEEGDLQFLEEFIPSVPYARGNFRAHIESRERNNRLGPSGFLTAQKIVLRSDYTPKLEDGSLDIRVTGNSAFIKTAEAKIGDGKLKIWGDVELSGLTPRTLNLHLNTEGGSGVNIWIPELSIKPGPVLGKFGFLGKKLAGISHGDAQIKLDLMGSIEEPFLSGEVRLSNAVFTYPPSSDLQSTTKTPLSKWLSHFFHELNWDVILQASNRTWYQNELVNAAVTGAINFTGKSNNLNVRGKIETEQGSLVYSGNEFSIKNATLEIETKTDLLSNGTGDKKNYVYLKALAEKEVFYTDGVSNNNEDTIVMVVDRSLLGEIQPRFYSKNNPNLSSQKALQLALGLPLRGAIENNTLLPDQRLENQEKSNVETDRLLRIGLIQLIDTSLASPLARALAQKTGLVDFIRVTFDEKDRISRDDPALGGESSNNITQNEFLKYAKGTKVKFGRGISRRLFADYSFRVDEFQEKLDLRHEVELAYRLKQNFFLRGITELDSERTLGRPPDRRALLENQWRFGLPKKKKVKQTN